MKTITLENGKKVAISEESYKALEDAVREVTWEDIYEKYLNGLSDPEFNSHFTQKVVSIKQLLITAKHLNGDWKPDFNKRRQEKYYIKINEFRIVVDVAWEHNVSFAYFQSRDDAQRAISILGEKTIRTAFNTDW